MTLHVLKLSDKYFDAVRSGAKNFEVRKNDRGFKVGDTICLVYYPGPVSVPDEEKPLDIYRRINYILSHEDFPEGVCEGYVVLGLGEC